MQVDSYTDRSNALEEQHFKQEIRQGTCRDSMRIVKTFRLRIAETKARNKKPPVAYERILKQASQRSLEELSVALEMPVDDVRTMFEQRFDELLN
jgi:CarD family transcriptional regulator